MDYKPSAERRAREGLARRLKHMDFEERRRKPNPERKEGTRARFIEIYIRDGYEEAKKEINAKFGKEVFSDNILKK